YHGGESPYGTGASAVEVGRGIADDFPRGDLPFVGCHADAVERGIAYSPARVVDYPFKGLFVVRVEGEPEVGDEVFDFLTLVERRTPVNLVGDIDFPECLLHGARLRIGTVQDGEIAVVAAMQRALLSDRFRHDLPLLVVAERAIDLDFLAGFIFGEDVLLQLVFVVRNDAVGCVYDILGRTV